MQTRPVIIASNRRRSRSAARRVGEPDHDELLRFDICLDPTVLRPDGKDVAALRDDPSSS